jgi:hypothetical protein
MEKSIAQLLTLLFSKRESHAATKLRRCCETMPKWTRLICTEWKRPETWRLCMCLTGAQGFPSSALLHADREIACVSQARLQPVLKCRLYLGLHHYFKMLLIGFRDLEHQTPKFPKLQRIYEMGRKCHLHPHFLFPNIYVWETSFRKSGRFAKRGFLNGNLRNDCFD